MPTDREWRDLGRKLDAAWQPERALDNARAVEATLKLPNNGRRRFPLLVAAFAALAATLVVGGWWLQRSPVAVKSPGMASPGERGDAGVASAQPSSAEEQARSVEVTALSAATTVTHSETVEAKLYDLSSGHARFFVEPDRSRPVRVTSGDVTVEVVGTQFDVWRVDAKHAGVRVLHGVVEVSWSEGQRTLHADDEGVFPPRDDAEHHSDAASERSSVAGSPSWKKLAEAGDYQAAYEAFSSAAVAVRGPEDLLLAADAARLSGHPEDAVPLLRRITDHFPSHGQAPVAAFTLGRVLLDELGRPEEAASAFARARAQGGLLAEDALAREALARNRAGQTELARELAKRYLKAQPDGSWASQLRQLQTDP